jgi:hypothetical protein
VGAGAVAATPAVVGTERSPCREGMAKKDTIEVEGTVTEALPNAMFRVE